jgi:hypothetical protein
MKMSSEEKILKKMGLDYTVLNSGCCGMAGSFGFEKEHYDISIKVGERVLLPAVREADANTLIVADGFSCREQIAQTTDRRALHLAELIQMALRAGARDREPEEDLTTAESRNLQPLIVAGALIAGASLGWALMRWYR